MKLLLLLLALPIFGTAQITITAADFGNANDTVRMSSTTDPGIDFSSTGTNFNWDFSMLVAESQTVFEFNSLSSASTLVQILFGNFAPNNYQASYSKLFDDLPIDQVGQFLPVTISDLYQFSKVTADSISSVGISLDVSGNQIPFRSDLIEKRYAFPLNFGDSYTGKGFTEMDLNPIVDVIWRQRRDRSSEVDGWGAIDLPMGTFDVLRVKHTIEETDSLYYDFLGTGTATWFGLNLPTAYIYEWIASGEKEPVLRIETSEVGGIEVVRNIEYRDIFDPSLASMNENSSLAIALYPNPANSSLHVKGIETTSNYIITNQKGAIVATGEMNSNQIDISKLTPGNYFLSGQSQLGSFNATFIKD